MSDVWVVIERDDDWAHIVAVYPTQELADEHVKLMGGDAERCDIREQLHPDAIDPVKQRKRVAVAEAERARYAAYRAQMEVSSRITQELRPDGSRGMLLCHCRTFTDTPSSMTEHGYCRFCGGWEPAVFLKHKGAGALNVEIDKLDLWRREAMRKIVAALPTTPTAG